MRTRMLAVIPLLLASVAGCGGSDDKVAPIPLFNLDFRGTFTGLPDTYAAASGYAGRWVDVPPGTMNNLVDVGGQATTVSITLAGRGDTFNPQTTTDSILLRDAVVNDSLLPPFTPFSATLTGLANGQYDVYYYFYGATSGLTVNGTAMNNLAGGSADALGAQGTNWDVTRGVSVTAGTLTITDTSATDSNGLSGIQLVRVQ